MMRRLIYLTMAVMAALSQWGCSGDEPAAPVILSDIVTFDGYSGGHPAFSFRKNGDSPLISLTGTGGQMSQTFKEGERLLLRYHPQSGEAYTSGPVTVWAAVRINYDKLRKGPLEGWDADPVYMLSLWRSGSYINMECLVEYSDSPRRFFLLLDETTADDEVPQLYLMHDMGDAPENFSRRIYASWDMAALWDKESCRGVTVHLRDSNRGIPSITFLKGE